MNPLRNLIPVVLVVFAMALTPSLFLIHQIEETNRAWKQALGNCPPHYYEQITYTQQVGVQVSQGSLYRYDLLTGEQNLVTKTDMQISEPTWARGGEFIVFTGRKDNTSANLWRVDKNGEGLAQLTFFTDDSTEFNPSISLDEKQVTFSMDDNHRIYVVDVTGENQQVVFDHLDSDPADQVFSDEAFFPTFVGDNMIAYRYQNRTTNVIRTKLLDLGTMIEKDTWRYCSYVTH